METTEYKVTIKAETGLNEDLSEKIQEDLYELADELQALLYVEKKN